ncbi:MAG TPA: AMP-binding protein [Opitutaceae bacterium]|nr:AMP-binding protein [Opitutaceae bacterium]
MPVEPARPSGVTNANIARHVTRMAAARPEHIALKIPRGRTRDGAIDYLGLTFAELDQEVFAWSDRLRRAGVRRGDRTLVMVRQGLPLIASAFAVFQIGAVPVIIDPGMGLKTFLGCVRRSRPRVLLGIPLAQIVSRLFRPSFQSIAVRVSASNSLTSRLTGAKPGRPFAPPECEPASAAATDLAAILFTSGSTGAPKGVCYEHGMFEAQVGIIRDTYEIEPGEIDLPLLPIFALFNPALGMTTVVPEIDPRRPAQVDPARIVQAIRQENVTNSFGSPTLWKKIVDHCRTTGTTLPSLRRVLSAGAPVPAALWRDAPAVLARGQLHSPYGATEALPVATVSASEIDPASVRGACVGRPVRGMDVKIIAIRDKAISAITDARELPPGEIGEIIVRGPVVTKAYADAPEATAAAKIPDEPAAGAASDMAAGTGAPAAAANPDGKSPPSEVAGVKTSAGPSHGTAQIWHRMGDCGFLDPDDRLWFCGRKAERVETARGPLFTEPCEQVFRSHPRVRRCALIGLGNPGQQRPALVVEAAPGDSTECRRFARELSALGQQYSHTAAIHVFYFLPEFPVDVRHNAKIHRLTLARWATTAKGFEIEPKR